jgi:hypothetical protein
MAALRIRSLVEALRRKVCTLLLDVEPAQIKPPLSKFPHTKAEEPDVWKLVESINKSITQSEEKAFDRDYLKENFEKLAWPALQQTITELRAQTAAQQPERPEK